MYFSQYLQKEKRKKRKLRHFMFRLTHSSLLLFDRGWKHMLMFAYQKHFFWLIIKPTLALLVYSMNNNDWWGPLVLKRYQLFLSSWFFFNPWRQRWQFICCFHMSHFFLLFFFLTDFFIVFILVYKAAATSKHNAFSLHRGIFPSNDLCNAAARCLEELI